MTGASIRNWASYGAEASLPADFPNGGATCSRILRPPAGCSSPARRRGGPAEWRKFRRRLPPCRRIGSVAEGGQASGCSEGPCFGSEQGTVARKPALLRQWRIVHMITAPLRRTGPSALFGTALIGLWLTGAMRLSSRPLPPLKPVPSRAGARRLLEPPFRDPRPVRGASSGTAPGKHGDTGWTKRHGRTPSSARRTMRRRPAPPSPSRSIGDGREPPALRISLSSTADEALRVGGRGCGPHRLRHPSRRTHPLVSRSSVHSSMPPAGYNFGRRI